MSPKQHHAAHYQEALQWIAWALGWAERQDWMPLEHDGSYTTWLQLGERRVRESAGSELVRRVTVADMEHNEQVVLGVPRALRGGGVVTATAFWVVTSGKAQTRRLESFWPLPSMTLREGSSSRRISFWALNHPVRWKGVQRANRNLAYHMGAVQKHGDPDRLELPAPGTCLRVGRSRPVPVVVERLEVESFDPLQVIGRRHDGRRWLPMLKEAPDPDAWRERLAK